MNNLIDLIKPISETSDVGVNLRESEIASPLYRKIKDARMEARAAERRYWETEDADRSKPFWQQVYDSGQQMLTMFSKDIEILAWMIESLLRLEGFSGLAKGFHLTQQMINAYQQSLHPKLAEDEGLEWKVLALTGLNGDEIDGSLIQPIFNVPITFEPTFTLWEYEQAKKVGDTKAIIEAITNTPGSFYLSQLEDIESAIENFNLLTKTLDEIFTSVSPPSTRIADSLLGYQQRLRYVLGENPMHSKLLANKPVIDNVTQPVSAQPSEKQAVMQSDDNGNVPFVSRTVTQPVQQYSRESALRELTRIGEFFSEIEPQSLAPYMLKRVVEWAELPLPELLAKMIHNSSELNQVYSLAGIVPGQDN
jgi:type VI secretion system protein ImpA